MARELIIIDVDHVWSETTEQRGARSGLAGVRENLLIDATICQDAILYKRNVSIAWIDIPKAYDTVSHELILLVLQHLKEHPGVSAVVRELIARCRTSVAVGGHRTGERIQLISYKRRIFQGNSLSPPLFCLVHLPLSLSLRGGWRYMAGKPNNRKHKVTHLLYIDDLKIYAKNQHDLQKMLNVNTGTHSQYDNTEHRRSVMEGESVSLLNGSTIQRLQLNNSYTYLGIKQREMHDITTVKATLTERYKKTLRTIWMSQLTAKHKSTATNMLAVPIVSHTFASIRWNVDEIKQLDRDTRKTLTMCRSPNASVQRLYLPRREGDRELINIE
ncbi:hypothetical protein Trydic_g1782 [Trypoxylus dichotomus]